MKKLFFGSALILLLLSARISIADSSPFQALRMIGSARATALAGSFVSVENDPAAVFYNPATIFTVKDKNFSSTFFKHILDINSGQVVYVLPDNPDWASDGVISTAVSYTSFGTFDYADKNGNRNGTFGANDVSLAATYANELDSNFYYGITAKLLFINIESLSSFAFAFDAGILYRMPEKRTNIGISILHTGSQLTTLDGTNEPLPLDIRAGINHRLRGLPLLLNFSFHHLADKTDKFFDKFLSFAIGGEFYFGKYLRVRLGYDNQLRRLTTPTDNRKFSGFSAGIGVQAEKLNFDYGVAQIGNAALLHRFTIGLEL